MAIFYLVTDIEGNKTNYSVINIPHSFLPNKIVSIILNDKVEREMVMINEKERAENELLSYLEKKGTVVPLKK